jgi:hypothetical protein
MRYRDQNREALELDQPTTFRLLLLADSTVR